MQGCVIWTGLNTLICPSWGIGTNIQGYARPEVDEADMETVQSGNMSTFKCPYESFLAEKLVELHSWANMVRFTISSGKANAIAIRIASEGGWK